MLACVDLPAFPLQLVWRDEPSWRALPVVIVDEDRPQGVILWACEQARALRVLPGIRYGHALSLARELRARVMSAMRLDAAIDEVAAALRAFSPDVEPFETTRGERPDATEHVSRSDVATSSAARSGTFWLDGRGLERIWTGDGGARWSRAIEAAIAGLGFHASVVVGFTRFGTYALAKARPGVTVLASDADERARARGVPLARLDVDPALRDTLARLAVHTVGELVRLPGGGVLERFGSEAHRLYQLAAGDRWDPLVPEPPPDAPDERTLLDDPERDLDRLVFAIKAALDRLLARLAAKHRAVAVVHLELTAQRGVRANQIVAERVAHAIRPAQPTLDGRVLLRLVRLRLEGALGEALEGDAAAPRTVAGIIAVRVWADDVAATREQLGLFAAKPRRDLRAADEAIARLRAELGDGAVVKAVVREAHLPEARFGWERLDRLAPARVHDRERRAIRNLLARPALLPPSSPHVRDDGWTLAGLEAGAVVRVRGPYIVSGGWWTGAEVHRAYHFAETRRGEELWLYFDRARRRWFRHGAIA